MATITLVEEMIGREGQKTSLILNGKIIQRKVYYNKHDGLFVLIRGYKIFAYDFYTSDTIEVDFL